MRIKTKPEMENVIKWDQNQSENDTVAILYPYKKTVAKIS